MLKACVWYSTCEHNENSELQMPYSKYTYIKAIVNTNITITETIYIIAIIIIIIIINIIVWWSAQFCMKVYCNYIICISKDVSWWENFSLGWTYFCFNPTYKLELIL